MLINIDAIQSSRKALLQKEPCGSLKTQEVRRAQPVVNTVERQRITRYAYLGPEATFTEAALRTLPGIDDAECISFPTVAAALDAVRNGAVDAAMAPLENSIEGGVPATMVEFVSGGLLHIVAEVHLKVEFALMGQSGAKLSAIDRVVTHPHAFGQCRPWLQQWLPDAKQDNASSTAAAAFSVAEGRAGRTAAIAASMAAERYGLEVLANNIGERNDSVTRFVLLRRPGPPTPRSGRDRTSIHAVADHDHLDWLRHVLDAFASRGVPVTRIDPRPTGAGFGRYHFLIDCDGHVLDPPVKDALGGLQQYGVAVRFLGSYPRGQ